MITTSIVIEWENARRGGSDRAARMLDELLHQVAEIDAVITKVIEIIFVVERNDDDHNGPRSLVAQYDGRWDGEVRVLCVPTGDYYHQKNLGAAQAKGDVLVFLDSDVIPQPCWLKELLSAISRTDIDVVGGATVLECSGFYSAAMALIWIFPLRIGKTALIPSGFFYANNFAVSAGLFALHPFPNTGQFRGQCTFLAEELRRHGHTIWLSQSARVHHPPPAGPMELLRRAWLSGRDTAIRMGLKHRRSFSSGTRLIWADLLWAIRRVRSDRAAIGFGVIKSIGATALATIYYAVRYAGFCFPR
jgi:glycosyltransferase involved in cell wall biosynthesis